MQSEDPHRGRQCPRRRSSSSGTYLGLEAASVQIERFDYWVPEFLQTRDYVRAIMTAPGVPSAEIATRVATRLGRKEAITKQNPAELLVLLGRAALNRAFDQSTYLRTSAGP